LVIEIGGVGLFTKTALNTFISPVRQQHATIDNLQYYAELQRI